jgi:hypothetical protein
MSYRAVATSVEGFVQQIACCYLRHGYWFYVTGCVPADKDPQAVDDKLIHKYGINVSESTRARRKKCGLANLQYLRFERFFVILATKGQDVFYETESAQIRDIRRIPLKFAGYSISYRRGGRTRDGRKDPSWHAHVRIERRQQLELNAYLNELAKRRKPDSVVQAIYNLPLEPYAPIRRQLLKLLRSLNRERETLGYPLIPLEVLPLRRRVVRPFANSYSEGI